MIMSILSRRPFGARFNLVRLFREPITRMARAIIPAHTPVDGDLVFAASIGDKKLEKNFKDGKRDGSSIMWYENGQKHYEDNYEDGLLDGYSVTYRENGNKRKEENYKHGFCLGRTNHVEG